jgi:hypothetical protein
LRYYLYPRLSTDDVIGPFGFEYRGQSGFDAYRSAIADRFFDTIVLDGGVTPQGNAIQQQLGDTIDQFYQHAFTTTDARGFAEEILTPKRPAGATSADDDPTPWPVALTFDDPSALDQWGAHPEVGNWQQGLQLTTSSDRLWEGHASLQFAPSPTASSLSLRRSGPVSRVRARLYLVPAAGTSASEPVRVGFMGFDAGWQWRDDGFRWEVPFGTWTTISWDLAEPADFEELGLKLPPSVATAYLGSFEIDP